jgi:Mrp family chromosome partitioning ATPase
LARGGAERVLLVDANPDHPSAHRIFGVDAVGGLVAITPDGKGNASVVQTNLYRLPPDGEEPGEQPSAVNSPRQLTDLIRRLRESDCAFVVVDLPPISETSLTLRIARLLDGLILVVPAEKVTPEAAHRARTLLSESRANVIGTVLNDRREYVPTWLHQPS